MTVEYLLSDHLGSTSLITNVNGAKVLELRYKAWGEVRATWTASPSTTPAYRSPLYTYTGQASYMDDPTTSGVTEGFGLMFYNARWYDPSLGRFAQADTEVPASQGVQGYDRYAYTNNNPIRYSDPTGHSCKEDCNNSSSDGRKSNSIYLDELENTYGWTFDGTWSNAELKVIYQVAIDVAAVVGGADVMLQMFGSILFNKKKMSDGGQTPGANKITMNAEPSLWDKWSVAHELGHAWNAANGKKLSKGLQEYVHSIYPELLHGRNGNVIYYGSPGDGPGATGWPDPKYPRWQIWDTVSKWNKGEDFAQSFAAYIYPQDAADKLKTNYSGATYGPGYSSYRDTPRGQYIASQIP